MYAHLHEFIYVHFSDQISVGNTETSWYLKPAGIYILQKKKKNTTSCTFSCGIKGVIIFVYFYQKSKVAHFK